MPWRCRPPSLSGCRRRQSGALEMSKVQNASRRMLSISRSPRRSTAMQATALFRASSDSEHDEPPAKRARFFADSDSDEDDAGTGDRQPDAPTAAVSPPAAAAQPTVPKARPPATSDAPRPGNAGERVDPDWNSRYFGGQSTLLSVTPQSLSDTVDMFHRRLCRSLCTGELLRVRQAESRRDHHHPSPQAQDHRDRRQKVGSDKEEARARRRAVCPMRANVVNKRPETDQDPLTASRMRKGSKSAASPARTEPGSPSCSTTICSR